ncbi:spore germination protein KB [Desulfitobacterium sp. LBE]|uniref:Spore germination protein n=3 Tax=root TaxID=1 RepID=A0A098B7B6_DESHA|nr:MULTISPECIES: endospore germination permease [Desulfitobacterium]EHL08923.1 spore germination protein [Desulfitobacterium hafniense DP7]MEA5025945.1 endospore germination permease [Desulfitobacterium hafniense]TWH58242.1 spore germination protein KB [Desulfitobacterium sp. LBE]CDX04739.1 Spore germination protein [Desulfitobacterium hafniense]
MIKLEKEIISSSQLNFLVIGFVTGGLVTVPYSTQIINQDNWLAVIIGFILSLPMVLIYIWLAQKFPQNNLLEIHDVVYGPLIGKLISAAYIVFIFNLLIYNLVYVGDFLLTYLLPETPMWIVLLMFTFVCAWAVRLGLEVIARVNPLFVVITLFITFSTMTLLIPEMDFSNLIPLFDTPMLDFIQGVHIMITIPYLEIVIFLFFLPSVNNKKQIKHSILFGFCFGSLFLLLPIIRNTTVLGSLVGILTSPSYESIRLIDIGNYLTRLEVLYAIALIIMLFIKSSLFYYVTVLGIAQLLRLRSYLPLVVPLGIIGICLSLIVHESSLLNIDTTVDVWPFFALPFEVFLPILTLLLAKVRKLPKHIQGG